MIRNMIVMLIVVGIIFGGIFGYHGYMAQMTKQFMSQMGPPPVTVSTMKAKFQDWPSQMKSVGTLRAVHGAELACEVAGLVQEIRFASGDEVNQGQVLVHLNADAELAQLRSLKIDAALAKTVLERDKKQLEAQAISQATFDTDEAMVSSKEAMVAAQQALVDKKTIKAPFDGKLGINMINVGQYLNPGDKIVSLQNLDQVYVDFYLPQQELSRIKKGQNIEAKSDAYPKQVYAGMISAINPKIDSDSRNLQVEAAIENTKHELLPGMFVTVQLKTQEASKYLTLPQTAVLFNPYGETVYVVEDGGKDKQGKPQLSVRQSFVTVADTRGDQVAIESGIKEDQEIVTMGGHKLRNGSVVIINNEIKPLNDPDPKTKDQ